MTTAALWPIGRSRLLHRAGQILCAAILGCCTLAPAVAADPAPDAGPLLMLGTGDQVNVQVYGRPELSLTTYVSDDGSVSLPLAGAVPVAGLSPAKAAQRIAEAFSEGNYLVNPQVTVTPVHFRGPQVSVLGAVRTPGRFVIESNTTLLDVLAMAGGIAENGANTVVLLRPGLDGKVQRSSVDLKGLGQASTPLQTLALRGGDSIFVPPVEHFYLTGEVRVPNTYPLEHGMTIVQAIALGGGVSRAGSNTRIEIKRRRADGTYETLKGNPNDVIQANDVIRIKESFF